MPSPIANEHFIPIRTSEVVGACTGDARLAEADRAGLRDCCAILRSIIHFEFHSELDALKELYAQDDPDRDTRPVIDADPAAADGRRKRLLEVFNRVLGRANYRKLGADDLNRALAEESMFNVRLHTDLGDFAELALFARGSRSRQEAFSGWLGLRRTLKTVDYYERVALYVRLKDAGHFAGRKRLAQTVTPGSTMLKLFRNIPKADLEMLFPNTEVRMKLSDQMLLGVPAVAGGLLVLVTKLGASLVLIAALVATWIGLRREQVVIDQHQLVALGLGLFALTVHLFRQLNSFKNRKLRFMKALSDSLYFKNLDNNAGVFSRLIDEAEEEEAKEALLAYSALLAAGRPLTASELDKAIEAWLLERFVLEVDFEGEDALAKLERFALVERVGERYRALPVAAAKAALDRRWDAFFQFA